MADEYVIHANSVSTDMHKTYRDGNRLFINQGHFQFALDNYHNLVNNPEASMRFWVEQFPLDPSDDFASPSEDKYFDAKRIKGGWKDLKIRPLYDESSGIMALVTIWSDVDANTLSAPIKYIEQLDVYAIAQSQGDGKWVLNPEAIGVLDGDGVAKYAEFTRLKSQTKL